MNGKVKGLYMLAGGLLAISFLVAGAFVFVTSSEAFSTRAERALPMLNMASQRLTGNLPFDEEPPREGYLEALAKALGITVEELEAAMEVAREAAIEDGFTPRGPRGYGDETAVRPFRGRHGGPGFGGPMSEYLAEALGVSVEELEAAHEEARETMLAEALASGMIDQEQYERFQIMQAVRPYLAEAMQEAMQGAFEEALSAAVADGAISQAEADQIKDSFGSDSEGFRPHMPGGGPGKWMGPQG